jgi:hemolysin III
MHAHLSRDGSTRVTDERVNTCTHLAAAVFALFGAVLLIVYSGLRGKPWHVVSMSVYGVCLVTLFVSSVLHHGVRASSRVEEVLRLVDYLAIFLLIAGTITPVCLVLLRGPAGWSLFGVAWAVALTGIIVKSAFPAVPKMVTNTLYLSLGWLGVVVAVPVFRAVSWPGVLLLALGGVLYSAGAVVFAIERPNPRPGRFGFHEIWHVFVMLGALTHFLFMYRFVMPAG